MHACLPHVQAVQPLELLLFGGYNLEQLQAGAPALSDPLCGAIDSWLLCLSDRPEHFEAMVHLRRMMDEVLVRRIRAPSQPISSELYELEEGVLDTVARVLSV